MNFDQITKHAKKQNFTPSIYTLNTIYPPSIGEKDNLSLPETGKLNAQRQPELQLNPNIMFARPQSIGDCPKSSLLAALNYHSSHSNSSNNHQAYDRWIRRFKNHIYDQDGYLIDLSFSLDNQDGKAREVTKNSLETSWLNYTKRYCTN